MKVRGSWRNAPPIGTNAALAFVLDATFLHSFKVLLYSLANTRSFLDLPILVFTQDNKVSNDEIVKAVSDEIRLISEQDINIFSRVAGGRVPERYKLDWIPKFTFLKWLLFNDSVYKHLIFIDADIVALSNADGLLEDSITSDLDCGLVFRDSLFTNGDVPLKESTIASNLLGMIKRTFPVDTYRLNTGVMGIKNKCLTKAFREELLLLASNNSYVNEQSYVTKFFEKNSEFSIYHLSARYNFGAGSLSYLSISAQLKLLREISLLHFPGSSKPWLQPVNTNTRFSHIIWRQVERETINNSGLIAEPWTASEGHERTFS